MTSVHICDDILYNILTRLPGKSLLRFRCVSKHCNRIISDPSFMKSRSRRMVLFPLLDPLAVIDNNVAVEDTGHCIARIPSPLQNHEDFEVSIVGTFNGVVLFCVNDPKSFGCQLILHNPLTRASKVLAVIDPPPYIFKYSYMFGFGHGETTPHDLKIVRIEFIPTMLGYKWDVFDLKTSLWSTPPQYMYRDFYFWGNPGVFVNGFLYWVIHGYTLMNILTFNVKEMVFSRINLPNMIASRKLLLGSLGDCLCAINISDTGFHVWLMKEESWMKAHSFAFGLKGNCFSDFRPICILGNGKILLTNTSIKLVIYDTLKGSYITLNGLETCDHFKKISKIFDCTHCKGLRKYRIFYFKEIRSIEYIESLVSPSNICFN